MDKKVSVITHCESHLQESFGLQKMLRTLKYYNPTFDVHVYDEIDLNRIYKERPGINLWSAMSITMMEIKKKTKCDIIVHIDCDSIILAPLTEILADGIDVFGVRNDFDGIGDRNESQNRPYLIKDIPNEKYLNCGFIATPSDEFLEEWTQCNNYLINKYGDIRNATPECPIVEQGSYNLVIWYQNKYKVRILDRLGGNVFYGCSANFKTDNNYIAPSVRKQFPNEDKYCWSSWRDIEYNENDGKFYLCGKQVKVLHKANGGSGGKLEFDLFNDKTAQKLKEITGLDR